MDTISKFSNKNASNPSNEALNLRQFNFNLSCENNAEKGKRQKKNEERD